MTIISRPNLTLINNNLILQLLSSSKNAKLRRECMKRQALMAVIVRTLRIRFIALTTIRECIVRKWTKTRVKQ